MKRLTVELALAQWAEAKQGSALPARQKSRKAYMGAFNPVADEQVCTLVLNGERQTINTASFEEEIILSLDRDKNYVHLKKGQWDWVTTAQEVVENLLYDLLDGIVEGITLRLEDQSLNRQMVFQTIEKSLKRLWGAIVHSQLPDGRHDSVKKALLKQVEAWMRPGNLRKINKAIWALVSEWHVEAL